jgi:hypothetical protein
VIVLKLQTVLMVDHKKSDLALYAAGIWVVVLILYLSVGLFLVNQEVLSPSTLSRTTDVVLVALTGLYVLFTGFILRESIRQNEQDVQPAFALQIRGFGIEVSNVGSGPALDTSVTLTLDAGEYGEESVTVEGQDIPAGESLVFGLGKFESYGRRIFDGEQFGNTVMMEGEYTDRYQNRREIKRRDYEVDDYRKRIHQEMFASKSSEYSGIERRLSNIQSTIENAVKVADLDMASVLRYIQEQSEEDGKAGNE